MKILIVEDSDTDRELLRFLLESRFESQQTRFYEAPTLKGALALAEHVNPNVIILDLQLPDSVGSQTFKVLHREFPAVPIIVMTHNKDRQLALSTIQAGAADFVIKNFTDEETLFSRILFAIEKHERGHLPPEETETYKRLEKARADIASARRTRSVPNMRAANAQATEAITEVSQKLYSDVARFVTQQETIAKTVESLNKELLQGHSNRPSMRSQLDLLEHRVGSVESGLRGVQANISEVETTQQREALQLETTKLTSRTKVLLGILALVGALAGAVATYEATRAKTTAAPSK